LQYLHILPILLGGYAFFNFDLATALLWGVTTIAYAWILDVVERGQGWLAIAGAPFRLEPDSRPILIDRGTALSPLLPGVVVNAVILLYCLWPRTPEDFAHA
jgi:hypothetical protein